MKIQYLFLYIFLALFTIACQYEDKSFKVSTHLEMDEVADIRFGNIISQLYDTIPLKTEEHKISIDHPQITFLTVGDTRSYLYLTPGKDISISNDGDQLSFTGSAAAENQLLQEVDNGLRSVRSSAGIREIADADEEEFLKRVDDKYEDLLAEIQAARENDLYSQDLINLLEKRIKATKNLDLLSYKSYHDYLTKDSITLSEDYYSFLDQLDINDPDLLAFEEGRSYIRDAAANGVIFQNSIEKYYQDLFAAGKKSIDNKEVLEYYNYYNIDNALLFGTIDEIQEHTDDFLESSMNEAMKDRINASLSQWENLRKGKVAPSFDGVTRDGDMVNLADLKGKNVYVDVWATWCGPCIAEIPSLKAVEKEFHGENIEFVSISIDEQKDKEKWEKFIEDRELGGTQLMEEGAWQSEIADRYNIKGIPRFILIDSDGNIVNANAKRPSNPELKENLKALL